VAAKYVEMGELVGPGRQIANLIDLRRIKVTMTIPEEEIVQIRKGQPARMHLEARPDIVFDGIVTSVGAKSSMTNGHAYPVEVSIANTMPELLKAGMFARVEIETTQADQAIVVSRDCLIEENNRPAIFVVDGEVARLRNVQIGIVSQNKVQIVQGVQVGDKVIIFGQKKLKDGAKVTYQ
jgi:RND family efflux transporter MFP subunit